MIEKAEIARVVIVEVDDYDEELEEKAEAYLVEHHPAYVCMCNVVNGYSVHFDTCDSPNQELIELVYRAFGEEGPAEASPPALPPVADQ